MNNKEKKLIQESYVKSNLAHFFKLLENRFNPKFDNFYVQEIKKLSQGFNVRLTREEKLKFCKKCNTYWNINTKEIRFNSNLKTIEHICKNCGFVRKFKYKN